MSWNWLLQDVGWDSSMPRRLPQGLILLTMTDDEVYERWAKGVPPDITADTIWRMPAYRFSLYLASCAQWDARRIRRHEDTRAHVDQLLRAVGGISASIDEGYSRSSGRERAHFYEYALGSARESRGWYYKCAIALPPAIVTARMRRLTQVVRILTAVIPRERASKLAWRPKRAAPNGPHTADDPAATSSSSQ